MRFSVTARLEKPGNLENGYSRTILPSLCCPRTVECAAQLAATSVNANFHPSCALVCVTYCCVSRPDESRIPTRVCGVLRIILRGDFVEESKRLFASRSG